MSDIKYQPVINYGNSPLAAFGAAAPSIVGSYSASLISLTGVVAANNFVSLFNPVSSTKTAYVSNMYVSCVASGATATTAPMHAHRITAASGGTLAAGTFANKNNSSFPDPTCELRTANPTVTLGAGIWSAPPAATTNGGTGGLIHRYDPPANDGPLTLAPGEGIVLTTDAGDVNQIWGLRIAWREVNI